MKQMRGLAESGTWVEQCARRFGAWHAVGRLARAKPCVKADMCPSGANRRDAGIRTDPALGALARKWLWLSIRRSARSGVGRAGEEVAVAVGGACRYHPQEGREPQNRRGRAMARAGHVEGGPCEHMSFVERATSRAGPSQF